MAGQSCDSDAECDVGGGEWEYGRRGALRWWRFGDVVIQLMGIDVLGTRGRGELELMAGKVVMIRGGFMSLYIWIRSKSWDGVHISYL